MPRLSYYQTLKREMDRAKAPVGLTRDQIEIAISSITATLKGPLSDSDRIILCAERAGYQKAVAALPHKDAAP